MTGQNFAAIIHIKFQIIQLSSFCFVICGKTDRRMDHTTTISATYEYN